MMRPFHQVVYRGVGLYGACWAFSLADEIPQVGLAASGRDCGYQYFIAPRHFVVCEPAPDA